MLNFDWENPPSTPSHRPLRDLPSPPPPPSSNSSILSENFPSSPPLPHQNSALATHGLPLTPAIIEDSDDDDDDDDYGLPELINDVQVPPQQGVSEGLRDLFGRTGGEGKKRVVLKLIGAKQEKDLHPYELAVRNMDLKDRRPCLLRVTPRPPREIDSERPEIEVLLLLSPNPESKGDQAAIKQIGEFFTTDHPQFEHIGLYAHYHACASATGEEENFAREAVSPVDMYSLRQNLKAGKAVSSLLGVKVLRRLIDLAVRHNSKRSLLVSGLGYSDREAVEMFSQEVVRPKALPVLVNSDVTRDDGQYAEWVGLCNDCILKEFGWGAVVVICGDDHRKTYESMQAAMLKRGGGWMPKASGTMAES